jgi:hypothetical protein
LDHGLGTEKGLDLSGTSLVGSTWLRPQEYDNDDDWIDSEVIEECAKCVVRNATREMLKDKWAALRGTMNVLQIPSSDSMDEN